MVNLGTPSQALTPATDAHPNVQATLRRPKTGAALLQRSLAEEDLALSPPPIRQLPSSRAKKSSWQEALDWSSPRLMGCVDGTVEAQVPQWAKSRPRGRCPPWNQAGL